MKQTKEKKKFADTASFNASKTIENKCPNQSYFIQNMN